jgi:hypothetical protein
MYKPKPCAEYLSYQVPTCHIGNCFCTASFQPPSPNLSLNPTPQSTNNLPTTIRELARTRLTIDARTKAHKFEARREMPHCCRSPGCAAGDLGSAVALR